MIGRLCQSEYLDELIGDLEELRARRARVGGVRYAAFRHWLDVASALVFQSRARQWTARAWGVVGALTLMTIIAVGRAGHAGAPPSHRITATDAAGVFTLDFLRGRVVGATVDGYVLPPERIVQRGHRLLLKGADWPNDLEVEITRAGAIRWEGRAPPRAAAEQEFPTELDWAPAYFAEVDSVSRADGGRLWGVPLAGPTLFVAPASRSVVANVPDSAGILTERAGVWVGTLPENVVLPAGFRPIGSWGLAGRKQRPPEKPMKRQEPGSSTFHETFHRSIRVPAALRSCSILA